MAILTTSPSKESTGLTADGVSAVAVRRVGALVAWMCGSPPRVNCGRPSILSGPPR